MNNERRRLLIRYVVPSVLSSVSIFLFTIVDGLFVGRGVGTDALGAVNLVFPYIMFFNALELLVVVGAMAILSIRMGRSDTAGANRVFRLAFRLSFWLSALMSLVGVLWAGPLARLMGANDTFFNGARDYLFWYSAFLLPCGLGVAFCSFVRNDGSPVLVSVSTLVSTALNIIGDYVAIYPLRMGLRGAAIATGVSQSVGLIIVLFHFILKRGSLRFGRSGREKGLLGKILLRGLPECVAQFCVPVYTVLMNLVLVRGLGDSAVNAFSVISYVAVFSVAVFVGTGEGLQPLFGRCYGARLADDLRYYLLRGLVISVLGAVVIILALYPLGDAVCRLYAVDAATTQAVLSAMPVYNWGFALQAVNVIGSVYLYSVTRTRSAFVINLLRAFVCDVAAVLLLPLLFGPEAVWYSFPVYEGLVMLVTLVFLWKVRREGVLAGSRE